MTLSASALASTKTAFFGFAPASSFAQYPRGGVGTRWRSHMVGTNLCDHARRNRPVALGPAVASLPQRIACYLRPLRECGQRTRFRLTACAWAVRARPGNPTAPAPASTAHGSYLPVLDRIVGSGPIYRGHERSRQIFVSLLFYFPVDVFGLSLALKSDYFSSYIK